MLKKQLFFIFSIFLVLPLILGTPVKTSDLPNLYLGYDGTKTIEINSYFSQYDTISIYFNLPDTEHSSKTTNYTITKSFLDNSQCVEGDIDVCVYPQTDDIQLKFISNSYNTRINFTISVYNNSDTFSALDYLACITNWTCIFDDDCNISCTQSEGGYFFVNSTNQTTAVYVPYQSSSLVGIAMDWFSLMFPNSDTLTFPQRMGYTIVAILITFLLLYIGSFVTVGVNPFIHTVFSILVFLEIFYFTAIGYIPISFIIIVGFLALALGFLKLRSG